MYPRSILHDSFTNITPIHRNLGVMMLLQYLQTNSAHLGRLLDFSYILFTFVDANILAHMNPIYIISIYHSERFY